MAITKVNSATFLSDTIILIKDKLKINISSVNGRVYTSYPKQAVTYPMISVTDRGIIQPSRMGMASEGTILTIDVEIRVWARNVKERDEIFQEIYEYLRTNQLDTTTGLSDSNLHDFTLMSVVNVSEDGDAGIQSKVMEVRFLVLVN